MFACFFCAAVVSRVWLSSFWLLLASWLLSPLLLVTSTFVISSVFYFIFLNVDAPVSLSDMVWRNMFKTFLQSKNSLKLLVEHFLSSRTKLERGSTRELNSTLLIKLSLGESSIRQLRFSFSYEKIKVSACVIVSARFHRFLWCFHCWLWTIKYQLSSRWTILNCYWTCDHYTLHNAFAPEVKADGWSILHLLMNSHQGDENLINEIYPLQICSQFWTTNRQKGGKIMLQLWLQLWSTG